MKNENEQLEALQDIRKMMKDSSKFLSLSGLSGVIAGVYALVGAYFANERIDNFNREGMSQPINDDAAYDLLCTILFISLGVLAFSLITAFFLSSSKAKKTNQNLFDHTSKKVFWCMAVPLFAGGAFCVAMLFSGQVIMVSSVMLLFYGMALLNSSKYTMTDIKYLAYFEIVLGLFAAFYPYNGILFWALGFGVLHIIYGSIMWFKYDRNI